MARNKTKSQGPKTHEQFVRMLEQNDDLPKAREMEDAAADPPAESQPIRHREARQSEFPVSDHGMNQESDHNKHNDTGQRGHKPQKHSPAEEKA
jgi:hypothetical protein